MSMIKKSIFVLMCMMALSTSVFGQGFGIYLNGKFISLDEGNTVSFSQNEESGTPEVTVDKDGEITVYEGGDMTFYGDIEGYFQKMVSSFNEMYVNATQQHYDWGYGSLMVIRDAMTADVGRGSSYNHYTPWSNNKNIGNLYARPQFCWKYYQTAVDYTNDLIAALCKIKNMNEVQRGYLATAYAFRALFYLDMARMWEFLPNDATSPVSLLGENLTNLTVPIVTEQDKVDSIPYSVIWAKKPRVSRDEAFAFIKSDLDKAEADIMNNGLDLKTVPDLTAVYGLKARLYMWMEDYANALVWAEKAIATGGHRPLMNSEILDTENGFNTLEPSSWIWGAQPKDNTSGILCWTSWMSNEAVFGYGTTCNVRISPYLYNKIGDNDVRKQLYKVTGKEPYITDDNTYSGLAPYSSLKFRPYSGECDDYTVGGLGAFPIMRIEEMYFIQAEAMAQLGNVDEAQNVLNAFVKDFRNPDYSFTAASKEQLIDEIFLQKQIELWGEGQIFFDYKRLNKPVDRVSHSEDEGFWDENDRLQSTTRPAWMNFVFPETLTWANLNNNPDPSGLYSIGGGVEYRDKVTNIIYFVDGFMAETFGVKCIQEVQQLEAENTGATGVFAIQKPFAYLAGMVNGLEVGDGGKLCLEVNGSEVSIPYQDTGLKMNGQPVYVSSTAKGTFDEGLLIRFPRNSIKVEYGNELVVSNSLGQSIFSFNNIVSALYPDSYSGASFLGFYHYDNYEHATLVTENGQLYIKMPYILRNGYAIKYYIGTPEDYRMASDSIYARLRNEEDFGISATEDGYAMIPVTMPTDIYYNIYFGSISYYPVYYILVRDGIAVSSLRLTYDLESLFDNYTSVDLHDNVVYNQYVFGPLVEHGYGAIVDANMTAEDVKAAFQIGRLAGVKEFSLNHTNVSQTETFDAPTEDGTYRVALISVYQDEPIYVSLSRSIEINRNWTKWQPWGEGTGSYTYANAWIGTDTNIPIFYRESLLPGSTMAQFRIDNWGAGESLYIDYDRATNQCYIAEQYTGSDYHDGSQILAADIPTWQGNEALRAAGYDSYYNPETGLFVLQMAYYCGAGTFGYNPEYFQCDGFYKPDYNVYMTYNGAFEGPEGSGAIVGFTKGADVASYKYLVLQGTYSEDMTDDLASLINDDKEGKYGAITSAEDGQKLIELQSDGEYTIVTANYDEKRKFVGGNICSFTYEASSAEKWESLGMCKYTDDLIGPLFQADPVSYPVEVWVRADKPGIYRMVNPYGAAFPYNEEGDWDASQDYYIDINAEDPNGVYIEEQETGCDWGYGMMSIMSMGYFYMAAGNSFEDVKNAGYMGTLENNVITFPVKGMVLGDDEGMYYGNKNGAFLLDLTPVNAKARVATARISVDKSLRAGKSDLSMPAVRKVVNARVRNISREQVWKGLQLRKNVKSSAR